MSIGALQDHPYTAADLANAPDDGRRYELIGGEIVVSPAPSEKHQRVSIRLASALNVFVESSGNGMTYSAPFDVHFDPYNVVQPDILVILSEHLDRVFANGITGAPDLVVEILSSSSHGRDRVSKAALYASKGIPEFWLVDPRNETVIVQVLREGFYRSLEQVPGQVQSEVLKGFGVELSALFAVPAGLNESEHE